jgi:TIR domain
MARVFISFIHEEAEYAEVVQDFITRILGPVARPFMSSDKLQVYAGEKWLERIMDELEEATVVILMLSDESVKRPRVNSAAGATWTRNIKTIPVCYRTLFKEDLPKPYSSLQAVGLQNYGDDEYLARSVAYYLGIPEPGGRRYADLPYTADEEAFRKMQEEQFAYKQLEERLKELQGLNQNGSSGIN